MKGELPQVELYESLLPWRRRPRFFNSFLEKKWIKFQHRHQISNRETDSVQANVTVAAEGIDQRYAKHIWLKFYEMILTFYPLFVGDWAGRRARCRKVARSAVCCRTSEQTCGCHRFGKPEMCLLWRKKNKREICSLVGKTLLPEKWKWVFFLFCFLNRQVSLYYIITRCRLLA